MRTRTRRLTPPADANELLAALRAGRLISSQQIRQLAIDWSESRPDEPDDPAEGTRRRALELVGAGLLTAWQVEQVLSGRARRLHMGRYRLLEWLGAGGMGSVYKAEHRFMKRVVALKILGDAPRRSAVELCPNAMRLAAARCRREVEAAARLSHPNIVAAFDAVRARGKLILVMEYVEGVDLGRLVAQAGPLPTALACEAVRQAALALQYAHDRGLLHCDVKPSNLLLVHPTVPKWNSGALMELMDGRRPIWIKLADMGLARRMDDSDGLTESDLEGTPDYLAPERGGGDSLDGRCDLYSLGCTFYHLLTGQPPFPGGDWAGKLLRHRLDSCVPIRTLRPDLPVKVAVVVERLTARDPADRYATADEAARAIEACRILTRSRARSKRWRSYKEPRTLRSGVGEVRPLTACAAPCKDFDKAPTKRFRPGLALAILLVAALLSGAAWCALPTAPRLTAAPPSATFFPFIVEGRRDGFASLAEAVAAADDGAVVTIRGAGPYPTPPLTWHGRSLTLRAAPDCRPCLEIQGSASDPWQTLLTTDRDLTLQGLDLRSLPNRSGRGTGGRLICCERANLFLADCRLSAPDGAGVVHRNGGELSLTGCRVETDGTAVSVEVGVQQTCRVRIVDTLLDARAPSSAGLALWAPAIGQPTTVEVELTNDTFRANRAIALTALPASLHVTARGNDFFFRDALLACAGYADRQAWRRTTTWEGRDNRYHGSGMWLTLDGRATEVNGLAAWRALWRDAESGSHTDAPDRAAELLDSPAQTKTSDVWDGGKPFMARRPAG
jgi:serine/threonine protein kinase